MNPPLPTTHPTIDRVFHGLDVSAAENNGKSIFMCWLQFSKETRRTQNWFHISLNRLILDIELITNCLFFSRQRGARRYKLQFPSRPTAFLADNFLYEEHSSWTKQVLKGRNSAIVKHDKLGFEPGIPTTARIKIFWDCPNGNSS